MSETSARSRETQVEANDLVGEMENIDRHLVSLRRAAIAVFLTLLVIAVELLLRLLGVGA